MEDDIVYLIIFMHAFAENIVLFDIQILRRLARSSSSIELVTITVKTGSIHTFCLVLSSYMRLCSDNFLLI